MIHKTEATAALLFQATGKALYNGWFQINKFIGNLLRECSFTKTAALHGMVSIEPLTLARVAWKTAFTFSKAPKEYGLETKISDKTPVLLLHGAAGNWHYLGDLAKTLTDRDIPVFVLNLGSGFASEEKRAAVHSKIKEIGALFNGSKVDIVAHSMGGSLAHASLFSPSTSSINEEGSLLFQGDPIEAKGIGKVITLALPYEASEMAPIKTINKVHDIYNITAKYDLLVGHKSCALEKDHSTPIDTTHIEIVYDKRAQDTLATYLNHTPVK